MSSRWVDSAPVAGVCLFLALGCLCVQAQDNVAGRFDAGSGVTTSTVKAEEAGSETLGGATAAHGHERSLLQRLGGFYKADWAGTLPSASQPVTRRALDAPLDSPPFSNSDWGYGGSVTIGVPDGNVYPVMTSLRSESSRTKLSGWITGEVNASTSSESNFPLTYAFSPNRVDLGQSVLVLERQPDTVQRLHFDWGFHVSALYGTDYRFTVGKGYLSWQLLQHNRRYGFDAPWVSAGLYFPVKEGLIVRIGRFLAVPGIETQLAPGNFNMTHSLLFTAAPSTEMGAIATLKLTKQWMVQMGISAGHDVAVWSNDRKSSAIGCMNYSTASNHDNFYLCANGINDGRYGYNNVQHYDGTWNHRFNAKWNMATEAWVMYEREVPNIAGNVAHPIAPEPGANGAFCAAGQLTCMAPAFAAVNYLNRAVNSKVFVGFRSDLLNDKKGQRTGIPGKYTENTLYATKAIGSTIMLRPELRFDHSWDRRGYNNGTARNQFFFGMDLTYKF